jgi:hypothetical protein
LEDKAWIVINYIKINFTELWGDDVKLSHLASNVKEIMDCSQNGNEYFFKIKCEECVISGFRHEIYENGALLGFSAANSDNLLPTFRDNLFIGPRS